MAVDCINTTTTINDISTIISIEAILPIIACDMVIIFTTIGAFDGDERIA